jgi:hypothetical protein
VTGDGRPPSPDGGRYGGPVRPRLLVGVASVTIVLATVVLSLALAGPGPLTAARPGVPAPLARAVGAAAICPANAQQCNPAAPGGSGPATSAVLLSALVLPVLTLPRLARIRRRRRAHRLARGVVPTLLRPPRSGLRTI